MKILLPNVMSDRMVEESMTNLPFGRHTNKWGTYPIDFLVEVVKEHAPIKTTGKAYWTLECKAKGHDWHYDGCNLDKTANHMPWCQYSAVGLISPPDEFVGGEFQYLGNGDEEDFESPKSYRDELYKSLLIYSSGAKNEPLLHRATPHTDGERWVILMFFEGDKNAKRKR